MQKFISTLLVGYCLSLNSLGMAVSLQKEKLTEKDLSQNIQDLVDTIESIHSRQVLSQDEADTVDLERDQYVKFSEIKSWRQAGSNAAGYDENGQLLALYDLSYQNIRSREFAGRSVLGTIGLGDLNLREMIRLLRKHISESRSKNTSEKDELFNQEDYVKIDRTLEALSQQYGDLNNTFSEPDWEKIPLKTDHLESTEDPHQFFRLADIDLEKLLSPRELRAFNEQFAKVQENFNALLDTDSSVLLEELAYQRNKNKSYSLIYQHNPNLDSARPEKVLDFRRYQSTFAYSLLNVLTMKSISQLVNMIPGPASRIIGYAIGRWMELYQQQVSAHRARAFQYLAQAELGMKSPLQFLTAREREKGGIYVLSHESGIFQRFFSPRKEAFYHKQIRDELEQVEKNKRWGQKNKHLLSSTDCPFFAFDLDKESQKPNSLLFMSSFSRIKNRPLTAIDYENPYEIRIKRNVAKGVSFLLQFVSVPLPGANMLMNYLYNFFVMNDINSGFYWDNRLISFLQENAKEHKQDLEWLYGQRLNPFEFDLEEEKAFEARARDYLKL